MQAKSKSQQRFMGMVHAVQQGKLDPGKVSKDVRGAASSMKSSEVKDLASTKHQGLIEKSASLTDYINKYAGRTAATIMGPTGPLSAIGAEKGKGAQTALGATAGLIGGGAYVKKFIEPKARRELYALKRMNKLRPNTGMKVAVRGIGARLVARVPQALGALAIGGSVGAYLGHGRNTKKKDK